MNTDKLLSSCIAIIINLFSILISTDYAHERGGLTAESKVCLYKTYAVNFLIKCMHCI